MDKQDDTNEKIKKIWKSMTDEQKEQMIKDAMDKAQQQSEQKEGEEEKPEETPEKEEEEREGGFGRHTMDQEQVG